MKKVLALFFALLMCLGLCACGGEEEVVDNSFNHYDDNSEESDNTEKEFTFTDATNQVRDSITGGLLYFRLKPFSAAKIDNISIATLTGDSTDDGWVIECKGTFTAYDDYGDVLDFYKFDVSQVVHRDGSTGYANVNVTKKY
ncbi:MAG: hypothetical protein IKM46_08155 [Clostridia bacterium]|nr:hypothetical protein [Clostridia bacterium]